MASDNDIGFSARFVLASLATWRVTHLLAEEDGPSEAVVRARARLGDSTAGALMDCFNCLSIWVAAPLSITVLRRPRQSLVCCLAVSGAACLAEALTRNSAPPALN
ncbi:MAG: DUF1360 domain-containing protein [Actinomycetota bacterium]|nr:DUF1360 domain-containing protein [Actinomycetota bacterium]